MSSPPTNQVTFHANLQPSPACYPSDINGMLTLIANGGISGTIPANAGGGIFVGSTAPSSSLTNKVWFKIDAAGRPLGIYMFYNGNWRKVYAGVGYGEIKMYHGSGANFDGTGLGIIGGDTDGWAICNGNYGTPNMTDMRFPAGGSWNGSAWTAPSVGGGRSARGGANGHQVQASDLPQLHVDAWAWPLTAQGGSGTNIQSISLANIGPPTHVFATWPVNETEGSPNNPLPLPQYNVFAFIMFVGYA